MKTLISIVAAAALAGLAGAGAFAQQSASPYKMNPNAPLSFDADEADAFNQTTCTSTLRGRVEIIKDKTRVRARELTLFHNGRPGDCGDGVDRWDAKGEVFYVTPDQRVRSDRALYDDRRQKATFTGNVVAIQGESVSTGGLLEVDLESNAFKMSGGASGRVRGVLYPKTSGARK